MKPVAFDYLPAQRLEDALAALAADAGAKLIAGGQSLGPLLNLRLVRPTLLVDLNRIEVLRKVAREGDDWAIGPMVTHATLEDGAAAIGATGMLAAVARGVAHRAIRNRGTIGGSLAHADPAGDWPLALIAMGATAVLMGPNGALRRLPVGEMIRGPFTTTLAQSEMLSEVRVPVPSRDARWGYFKFCRKGGELPEAAAAVVIDRSRGHVRIVLGALGGAPRTLPEPETLLRPDAVRSPDVIRDAVARAVPELDPIDLQIRSETLRRALAQALT